MDKEKRKQIIAEYKMQKVTGGVYTVRNRETGTFHLKGDSNLEGSHNRFEFSRKMNNCLFAQLRTEWEQYGPEAFEFLVLEETEQKETESLGMFKDRLKKMEELWREKLTAELSEPEPKPELKPEPEPNVKPESNPEPKPKLESESSQS